MVKKCENSQTGGRGSATWEFFPHNPVFFLTTFLNGFCRFEFMLRDNFTVCRILRRVTHNAKELKQTPHPL